MTVTAMPPPTSEATGTPAAPARRGGVKKLLILLVIVLALGGGGYWYLRPQPAGPPQPGEVVKLDPIQVNLAAAHYLRVGLALQLTSKAEEVDGAKALDAAIDTFSGQTIGDVNDPAKRQEFKGVLEGKLEHLYEGAVMGVYFTEYVTQ